MNKCFVIIKGIGRGILLHSPKGMIGKVKTAKKIIPLPEDEAEAACYRCQDGTVGFPSMNIQRGLIEAASGWKLPDNKKLALTPFIAGDVTIEPEMISFGVTDYEIDVRRAVVQRQGIIRARPLLREWQLSFEVQWEGQHLGSDFDTVLLRDLLDRLGGSIGIGDFRPAKKGPFGKFEVVSIER